jgi:hypothetical protein
MIIRCSWCSHILWPFQKLSAGRTLHERCWQTVNRIMFETQKQYMPEDQWEQAWMARDRDEQEPAAATPKRNESYEMFLARLEDEDGGW